MRNAIKDALQNIARTLHEAGWDKEEISRVEAGPIPPHVLRNDDAMIQPAKVLVAVYGLVAFLDLVAVLTALFVSHCAATPTLSARFMILGGAIGSAITLIVTVVLQAIVLYAPGPQSAGMRTKVAVFSVSPEEQIEWLKAENEALKSVLRKATQGESDPEQE